ncbi:MAG: RNA-directed DNA polymerase [Candidatus Thiodiazotropha taylori]|nr:RNA-directed DNA polymerase [Candidatus Thiodiazotropha taylori]
MLQARVIQPSSSEWGSPPVLVRKRDGSVRWCVDYRALNNVTVKDVYPLPLVEDCMDMLSGNVWYSKLDANSAYWQIRIKPEDCKKTAFLTKYGLFEFVRMAFGLCNAPATYARAMNLVLHGLNWNQVLAFLDDMLALGKSFEGHLQTLREVFTRFRFYQLKLKPKKCELFQRRVEFLGRYVGPDGLEIGISDIQTVLDWPHPKSVKDVEKFLGLLNYHRSFIKDYAKKAAPLYQITGKKCFVWENEQEESFQILKNTLTTPPILGFPTKTDPFILDTDASEVAIGGVLLQVQNGVERVLCYGSYSLSPEQKRYCTTRKELHAMVRFTRQFRHYLWEDHSQYGQTIVA